ncbi:MAG: ABC transporter ATP-binding protein [Gomphosphaeria aponina SAG 52.96 = DSM 107014]|uniref:ABC transporter ATP-binding protein n=1 Tax=Gomphosphaeria aponina SAG 52.96 = DSM 107014 TaxID=1521640 RepID=A0A941GMQ2_9CHRO|nr:ABC transporter ATP-binding protein [Gomphosphaeria aponina SAG 52.96 = DSM 107014]
MSETIIKVENLGKKYIIGHQQQEKYTALRDVLANGVKSLGKRLSGKSVANPNLEEFWALKDVSFEVKQGEVIGIIGRNGAGKSTLLKILSRITEPTTGKIKIKGRVASLLEVGTGFHPELTGRENIFLNGAILGMSKAEIKKKFDEIVAFAEVEKFLDTPVKRYSSGMYVRLAFAVAAHLEPEILVVDEVLAVGDAAFQKKCLGKMGDVATKEGRTVLFVSHNMEAVSNLCKKAILLKHGKVILEGNTFDAIQRYIQDSISYSQTSLDKRKDRKGDGKIRFTSVNFQNKQGQSVNCFATGQDVKLILSYTNKINNRLKNFRLDLGISNHVGQRITWLSTEMVKEKITYIPKENNQIEIFIEKIPLTPGKYIATIYCEINASLADWIEDAFSFEIQAGDFYGTGKLPPLTQGNFLINSFQISEKK